MQDHNILLSLSIISVYILTVLVLWNMFSKGHVTVTSCLFLQYDPSLEMFNMVFNTLWNIWHGPQHSFQHGSYYRWIFMFEMCWKHLEKISVCSENCKKACWKFQYVLKTVMHVVCLKFQHIKTMLNISGCVENMLKISKHVEDYNMCRKLCWNSMLKISACVEHCNACWKPCQNFKAHWKCLC